eukprot:TRINITY_DN55924_c0_g1_i1.p1 TRINITY_DN55924_c0_g1~~TRINITY_DN55924_c0_g1_i1.p1  ORF type:complete len:522 (-),score=120.96 TRINITY_DN55924_c0_g1_i1:180-1745(-)
MAPVRISRSVLPGESSEVFVARLLPAESIEGPGQYEFPESLRWKKQTAPAVVPVGSEGASSNGGGFGAGSSETPLPVAVATHPNGYTRSGVPTDVKTKLHWVLEPTEGGGYVLRPLAAWYEFSKPSQSVCSTAAGAQAPVSGARKRKAAEDTAEMELRLEAANRKQIADRWDDMTKRRSSRRPELHMKAKRVGPAVFPVAPGEDLSGDGVTRKSTDKTAYPEAERLNDDTGLKQQTQKRAKKIKKEANKIGGAEDEDAPTSANSLHELKRQKGEGGWDFSDEELHSDDEQDRWDFNDQLKHNEEEEKNASADEEIGEEGEKGDLLTSHGKQIELLLQNNEEGGGDKDFNRGGADDGGSSASEEPSRKGAAPVKESSAAIAGSASLPTSGAQQKSKVSARAAKAAASRGDTLVAPAKAVSVPVTSRKRATPTPANHGVAPPPQQETAGQSDETMAIRQRVVQCLQKQGGRCTLKAAAEAVGLKDSKSKLYEAFVAVAKEVAKIEKIPGERRPLLVLKPEYAT